MNGAELIEVWRATLGGVGERHLPLSLWSRGPAPKRWMIRCFTTDGPTDLRDGAKP
jgi:hypothetical protein